MNTKFEYLYRDASNYKTVNEFILEGTFTEEDEEKIIACLFDGDYFIPCQLGLPEERFEEWTEDDHCWFEYLSMSETRMQPDLTEDGKIMTVGDLVAAFEKANKEGWNDQVHADEILEVMEKDLEEDS